MCYNVGTCCQIVERLMETKRALSIYLRPDLIERVADVVNVVVA